jgi:IclR family acetate operon transcriptional repressor
VADSSVSIAATTGGAKSLIKGLLFVDLIARSERGLQLSELVELGGAPRATVIRLLGALEAARLILVDDKGAYRLGPKLATWGSLFLASVDTRRLAADILQKLAESCGETCHLAVRDDDLVIYIDKVDSPYSLRMVSRVGATAPLHSTSLGKAMLAHLPPIEVDRLLSGPLERRTPNTITDRQMLHTELGRIRERGFAIDDVENEEGIRCVAAPVFDHQGMVIAAISVAGPTTRVTREGAETLALQVMEAAAELSRRHGFNELAEKGASD